MIQLTCKLVSGVTERGNRVKRGTQGQCTHTVVHSSEGRFARSQLDFQPKHHPSVWQEGNSQPGRAVAGCESAGISAAATCSLWPKKVKELCKNGPLLSTSSACVPRGNGLRTVPEIHAIKATGSVTDASLRDKGQVIGKGKTKG